MMVVRGVIESWLVVLICREPTTIDGFMGHFTAHTRLIFIIVVAAAVVVADVGTTADAAHIFGCQKLTAPSKKGASYAVTYWRRWWSHAMQPAT